MKATKLSMYLKRNVKGKVNKIHTYEVTGSAKDVAAYVSDVAKRRGIDESAVIHSAAGHPLFWFVENFATGQRAEQSFDMVINEFSGRVTIKDTPWQEGRTTRLALLYETNVATIQAEIDLGIRQVLEPVLTSVGSGTRTTPIGQQDPIEDPEILEQQNRDIKRKTALALTEATTLFNSLDAAGQVAMNAKRNADGLEEIVAAGTGTLATI